MWKMAYLTEISGKGGIHAKCVMASIANDVPLYTVETYTPKLIDHRAQKGIQGGNLVGQKKVFTATEWDNFFLVWLHKDSWYPKLFDIERKLKKKHLKHEIVLRGTPAHSEAQELAHCIYLAIKDVKPKTLHPGEWHTPYALEGIEEVDEKIKSSIAGCARGS